MKIKEHTTVARKNLRMAEICQTDAANISTEIRYDDWCVQKLLSINSTCQAFEMSVITYERKLVRILKTKLVYNNMLKSWIDNQSFMDMLDADAGRLVPARSEYFTSPKIQN
jgi:hypothetical protein